MKDAILVLGYNNTRINDVRKIPGQADLRIIFDRMQFKRDQMQERRNGEFLSGDLKLLAFFLDLGERLLVHEHIIDIHELSPAAF